MNFRILFVISLNLKYIICALSGLYFDNGRAQTVIERSLSIKEKLKFERKMFDFLDLGLTRKPKSESTRKSNFTFSSTPNKYMLDIYNAVGSSSENDLNLKLEDIQSIKESDSIITFLMSRNHINSKIRHEKGGVGLLWFDISNLPTGNSVLNAELRIYKLYNHTNNDDHIKYTITVYQVVSSFNDDQELEYFYIDAIKVQGNYAGWLVLNVTTSFLSWSAFQASNRGLYISVHKHLKSVHDVHEIHPEMMGVITSASEGTIDLQPFLVAFLKNDEKTSRRVREATNIKRRKRSGYDDISYNWKSFSFTSTTTRRSCMIQSLYVNFKELNWDWVHAPDGFAAHYCSGICDFPLNSNMNATNHAIIQTLVNLIDPLDAPKPCCVPTKLASMPILIYLDDSSVLFRSYKNMIVISCGCN